jgi:hypothetical protein
MSRVGRLLSPNKAVLATARRATTQLSAARRLSGDKRCLSVAVGVSARHLSWGTMPTRQQEQRSANKALLARCHNLLERGVMRCSFDTAASSAVGRHLEQHWSSEGGLDLVGEGRAVGFDSYGNTIEAHSPALAKRHTLLFSGRLLALARAHVPGWAALEREALDAGERLSGVPMLLSGRVRHCRDAGRCPDNCRRCPDICRRCPDTVADNCRRCPDNCRRAADSCRGAATTVADTRGASSDSRRLLSDTCRAERSDCRRQLTGDRRNLFQLAPATSGKEFRTFGSGKRDQR